MKKAVDGNSDIVKLVVMDKEFKKDKKKDEQSPEIDGDITQG